uniref:Uncharacterized protein n=1 Tax=Candidatus Kentrum sp. SD TaxID=2126332 RepID=A0A450YGZ2_9GAMM|nr:MAG: hypothetical protein BECKSD772F_GA0070984_10732 [Candidatus Kentron sp. SD]VFK45032.1 MAG: hypothetical protein BECKSD772E_GA0070983_10472 [Candidatus Kentron sp. SD]VFK81467.1 MAG: hypothetical protein BECKSD772D_GA0070982_14122 [Candidatus Kentron sp. SD]
MWEAPPTRMVVVEHGMVMAPWRGRLRLHYAMFAEGSHAGAWEGAK